jgi:hypothetical protein
VELWFALDAPKLTPLRRVAGQLGAAFEPIAIRGVADSIGSPSSGGDTVLDWLVKDFAVLGMHVQAWMPIAVGMVGGAFWLAFGKRK